jgi:hypothetical protein
MKTYFLLVAFVWLWAVTGLAQRGLWIQAKVIPQRTYLANKTDRDAGASLDYGKTIGFAGGVTATATFSDNAGILIGGLYAMDGQKYVGDSTGGFRQRQMKLNYLKVPLMLRFNTNPYTASTFVVGVGAQYSHLLRASVVQDGQQFIVEQADGDRMNWKDTFKPSSIDLVLEIGSRLNISDYTSLGLSLWGDYSLGDIEAKDYTFEIVPETSYWSYPSNRGATHRLNMGLAVSLGYFIGDLE